MEKLLSDYLEKFGEQFPIMLVRGMDDDEIESIIKRCLDSGEPYEPELDENSDY